MDAPPARTPLLLRSLQDRFAAYFDSDTIDLRDQDDLGSRAEAVVRGVVWDGTTPAEIIAVLTEALRRWDRDVFEEFGDASNVDWTFDSETTESLKAIIEDMLAAARDQERTGEIAALRKARDEEIAAGKYPAASAAE